MGRRSDLINLFSQGIVPGRKIYAHRGSGNDGFDGSESYPYNSVNRARQDIRNGFGDALVLIGDQGGTWEEDPVIFDQNEGFAIYYRNAGGAGMGAVTKIADGGTTEPFWNNTLITRLNGAEFRVTTDRTHGLTADMAVLFAGVTQTGGNYIIGFKRVKATTATTFDVQIEPATLDAGAEPFLSGTGFGVCWTMPWSFMQCDEVALVNVRFAADLFDFPVWGGAAFVNQPQVGVPVTNRISFLNCSVKKASIGFGNMSTVQSLFGTGTRLEISGCNFSPSLLSLYTDIINNKVGSIYLDGGFEYAIEDGAAIYDATDSGLSGPEPWAPDGVIQWTGGVQPGSGLLISGIRWPIPTGRFGIQRDKLYKNWGEFQEGLGARTFAKRNFFADIETIQDVAMDSEGFLVDREPQTIINQNLLSTHSDLIWERNAAGAGAVADTMGEVTVLGLYADGVHFDGTASNTNTVLGVDGTRSNPVSSEAALRTLSNAVGHKLINVANGTLTLSQAWNDYRFFGEIGPEECVVAFAGQDCDGSAFERMKLTGALGGAAGNLITGLNCIIEDLTGLKGTYSGDLLLEGVGNVMAGAGATFRASRLLSPQAPFGATVDLGGGGRTFIASFVSGSFGFLNIDSGTPASVLGLVLLGASIVFDATSSGGVYILSGIHNEPLVLGGGSFSGLSTDNSVGVAQLGTTIRAAPGDAMDLVADAVDAAAVAASGANEIRDTLIDDATRFSGADVAAILADTAAIDARLPSDPADQSLLVAEHDATQALIAALSIPTVAAIVDGVFDEDIVTAHGTVNTSGLLLRALGALISQRTNNPTLAGLIGAPDAVGATLQAEHDQTQTDVAAVQVTADAIDAKTTNLPTDPADQSLLQAEHDATQALIAALDDPTAAEIADAVLTEALADHDGTAGSLAEGVSRLFGGNTRTKLFFSTEAIDTGSRVVPILGVSHMAVEYVGEGDTFPGTTYYVVFSYRSTDTASNAPAVSSIQATAPTDGGVGGFTSVDFP